MNTTLRDPIYARFAEQLDRRLNRRIDLAMRILRIAIAITAILVAFTACAPVGRFVERHPVATGVAVGIVATSIAVSVHQRHAPRGHVPSPGRPLCYDVGGRLACE